MLDLIHKTVTKEENKAMLELSVDDEIEWVVKDQPKEKSSGIDGVIAKVLQWFWLSMKPTCVALVHVFWMDGKLTSSVSIGVIKLIPKNMEIFLLLKWSSLTMLTLIEKLYTKILASRMKGPTNRVINP